MRDGWGEGGTPPAEGWMEGWGAPKARKPGKPRKPRKLKQKLGKKTFRALGNARKVRGVGEPHSRPRDGRRDGEPRNQENQEKQEK